MWKKIFLFLILVGSYSLLAANGFSDFYSKVQGTWLFGGDLDKIERGSGDYFVEFTYIEISDCQILKSIVYTIVKPHEIREKGIMAVREDIYNRDVKNNVVLMSYNREKNIFVNWVLGNGPAPLDFSYYDEKRSTLFTSPNYHAIINLANSDFNDKELADWVKENAISQMKLSDESMATEFFWKDWGAPAYPFDIYFPKRLAGNGWIKYIKLKEDLSPMASKYMSASDYGDDAYFVISDKLNFLFEDALIKFPDGEVFILDEIPVYTRCFSARVKPKDELFISKRQIEYIAKQLSFEKYLPKMKDNAVYSIEIFAYPARISLVSEEINSLTGLKNKDGDVLDSKLRLYLHAFYLDEDNFTKTKNSEIDLNFCYKKDSNVIYVFATLKKVNNMHCEDSAKMLVYKLEIDGENLNVFKRDKDSWKYVFSVESEHGKNYKKSK